MFVPVHPYAVLKLSTTPPGSLHPGPFEQSSTRLDGVGEADGVSDGVGELDAVSEIEGVTDGVVDIEADGVTEGVREGVGECDADGLADMETEGDDEGNEDGGYGRALAQVKHFFFLACICLPCLDCPPRFPQAFSLTMQFLWFLQSAIALDLEFRSWFGHRVLPGETSGRA